MFLHLLTKRREEESTANNDRGCSTPKNGGPEIMEEQPRTPRNGTGQKSKNSFSDEMDLLEE